MKAMGLLRSIALAALLSGCATSQSSMLPPELGASAYSWYGPAEPALWRGDGLGGYQSRIRVLFRGASLHNTLAIIRVDRDANGRGHGVFVKADHTGAGWIVRERRSFLVGVDTLDDFEREVTRSGLFQRYPEIWRPTGPRSCNSVDVTLERVTPAGYRYSNAKVQCGGAPQEFLSITHELIDMADEKSLNALLMSFIDQI
jgi:hypothetical protein